jgi:prolyl-tRNA synthetase
MKTQTQIFVEQFTSRPVTISTGANGEAIKQNERNQIKAELLQAIATDLSALLGVEVLKVDKGFGFMLPHNNEGSIPMIIDLTVKGLDYDVVAENEAFVAKETEKLQALLQRQKEKENKFKVAKEKRDLAKLKKVGV